MRNEANPVPMVLLALVLAVLPAACGDDDGDAQGGGLEFGAKGSIAAPAGRGSFSFGVATAATQIEDANPDTDWYLWTAPPPQG